MRKNERARKKEKVMKLERELAVYRDRLSKRAQECIDLKKQIEAAINGSAETNRAVDAILAQTALKYGERAMDEETGEELGWRLSIPLFSVSETLERYEIRTRRDENKQAYIVGVMEKKGEA